jgi:hypothetical protein
MPYGKKPGYASRTSERLWCEQCRCYRYGQVVHRYEGVPGLPGADPNRVVEVGKTTQCDKCGHKTTRYVDD